MSNQTNIQFSEASLQRVQEIIKRYPEGKQKSALLPLLHLAQEELGGWLSVPVMDYVAQLLSIKPIEVYEVASFYTMFNLKPVGKYLFEVCRTSPCCHVGAMPLIHYLEKKLQVKEGEVTADGMFSFKAVECLGSCGTGPVIQLGDNYYERMTPEKVDQLIDILRTKQPSVKDKVM